MLKKLASRPRYYFDRFLGVVINTYILITIVYIIDRIVERMT